MKKAIAALGLAVSMSLVAAPAQASIFGFFKKEHKQHVMMKKMDLHKFKKKGKCKPKSAVPEIDVAGAGIALALLGGVVSISRERRKQK